MFLRAEGPTVSVGEAARRKRARLAGLCDKPAGQASIPECPARRVGSIELIIRMRCLSWPLWGTSRYTCGGTTHKRRRRRCSHVSL